MLQEEGKSSFNLQYYQSLKLVYSAGAFAAALTNPLDVAKTRLQTQSDVGIYYKGMVHAFMSIKETDGIKGYAKGLGPRMIFHSMSAGILWGTYEYVKYVDNQLL